MKIILNLILLSNLNAQEFGPLNEVRESISVVGAINNGSLTNSPGPLCLINPPAENSNTASGIRDLYQRCAVDLCGTSKNNISIYNTDDSYSRFLSTQALLKINTISSTINQVVTKVTQDHLQAFNDMNNFVKAIPSSYNSLDNDIKQNLNSKIFGQYVKISINNSGPVANRVQIETQAPFWADQKFKEALDLYAKNEKINLLYNISSSDKLQLTDSEYITLLKNLISKIDNALLKKPDAVDAFMRQAFNDLKNQTFKVGTTKREDILLAHITTSSLVKEIEKNGVLVLGGSLCDSKNCETARAAFFNSSEFQKPWNIYEKSLTDPRFISQSEMRCKAALISSEIEESDRVQAIEIYNKALKQIKNNYLIRFSAESKLLLEKYLNESVIASNHSTSKLGPKVDNIANFTESASKYLNDGYLPLREKDIVESLFTLVNDPNAIEVETVAAHPCKSYSSSVWDAFLSLDKVKSFPETERKDAPYDLENKDRIFISPVACQHADRGVHIVGHELGHALNSFFIANKLSQSSSKTFNTLRSCANQIHTNEKPLEINQFRQVGDTYYTEEDTADLIANIAMADKKIYSCTFLKPSLVTDSYLDLDFGSRPLDSHSNSFSRVILEVINKGLEMPKSCNDLIRAVKPQMSFKKCI